MTNGFFFKMTKEAEDELASGEVGWRDAPTNTVVLACFGMLMNHLASRIVKPLWWCAGCVTTGVVGYLLHMFLA